MTRIYEQRDGLPVSTLAAETSAGAGDEGRIPQLNALGLIDLTMLSTFTSSAKGVAPLSGGGTANFLRADGTWAAPPGATSGTVTTVSVVTANGLSGSVANPTTTPAITLSYSAPVYFNQLAASVTLTTLGTYYDGPSVSQPTGGTATFFCSGTVSVRDTDVAGGVITCQLWDGTTVISSSAVQAPPSGVIGSVSLSGVITAPAGNIRISCANQTHNTTGSIRATIGLGNNASTLTVIQIAP